MSIIRWMSDEEFQHLKEKFYCILWEDIGFICDVTDIYRYRGNTTSAYSYFNSTYFWYTFEIDEDKFTINGEIDLHTMEPNPIEINGKEKWRKLNWPDKELFIDSIKICKGYISFCSSFRYMIGENYHGLLDNIRSMGISWEKSDNNDYFDVFTDAAMEYSRICEDFEADYYFESFESYCESIYSNYDVYVLASTSVNCIFFTPKGKLKYDTDSEMDFLIIDPVNYSWRYYVIDPYNAYMQEIISKINLKLSNEIELKSISNRTYYLYDYIKKRNLYCASEFDQDISRSLLRMKNGYSKDIEFFYYKAAKAIKIIANKYNLRSIGLLAVPSSKVNHRSSIISIIDKLSWFSATYLETYDCCKALFRTTDVTTSHFASYGNRPDYKMQKESICCEKRFLPIKVDAYILIDDIYTFGTTMNACRDVLIECGGIPEDKIFCLALAKTKR